MIRFGSYQKKSKQKIEDKINTKISNNIVYAYRYKRNRDLDLDIYPGKEIDSFHSDGMHINTEKLYKVFESKK